jgi:hypothetical protein
MTRAYGLLLRLYPKLHRNTFSGEMCRVFSEQARERRQRGWPAFLCFLLSELGGVLQGSVLEWVDTLIRSSSEMDSAYLAQSNLPQEVVAAQLRVRHTLRSMEYAIAHHQFAEARRLSQVDLAEREFLHNLWVKHGLPGEPETLA